jgi:hypothetical protein
MSGAAPLQRGQEAWARLYLPTGHRFYQYGKILQADPGQIRFVYYEYVPAGNGQFFPLGNVVRCTEDQLLVSRPATPADPFVLRSKVFMDDNIARVYYLVTYLTQGHALVGSSLWDSHAAMYAVEVRRLVGEVQSDGQYSVGQFVRYLDAHDASAAKKYRIPTIFSDHKLRIQEVPASRLQFLLSCCGSRLQTFLVEQRSIAPESSNVCNERTPCAHRETIPS